MANHQGPRPQANPQDMDLTQLTLQLRDRKENDKKYAQFHGDKLIGDPLVQKVGTWGDIKAVIQPSNWPALGKAISGVVSGKPVDLQSAASIAGSLSDYSVNRAAFINNGVKDKYDKMLHPPLTYLGDAFQYRTADGKFNSALNPHLGQAGAPYAKTVPSKSAPLGALPDPSDLFDKLMAREDGGRESKSGLSAWLIYHATIIIHDIFRTNDHDKNISDSSSYLDLSPLYGYTDEMQRKVRDGKYKLGLLKPDTFAEDRLLRQPPGVCIYLVMYNRYHNYAARQLLRINENGRFTVPAKYGKTKLVSLVQELLPERNAYDQKLPLDSKTIALCNSYEKKWREAQAATPGDAPSVPPVLPNETPRETEERLKREARRDAVEKAMQEFEASDLHKELKQLTDDLQKLLADKRQALGGEKAAEFQAECDKFEAAWEAAWDKQDNDLFNTARLITCGLYVQISVHDYLRALMGFHQFDTNFTLDPRGDFDQRKTSRGIGNQVTVEFNLLYRFHCAISRRDEQYTVDYMKGVMGFRDPENTPLPEFLGMMAMGKKKADSEKKLGKQPTEPWEVTFGVPEVPATPGTQTAHNNSANDMHRSGSDSGTAAQQQAAGHSRFFERNPVTNLFDDEQMLKEIHAGMDDPISNFGPRNVPKCLKAVEIMGILQARKWECGTLNDFRDFFGMPRHTSFESISKNVEIQNALRDLYENVDTVELYPGVFCESDEFMGLDPGPRESSSALWAAIFSDAITLVRSDRFYTVDWNTNSLTSWGMKEVTPSNEICKSSVFHRLLQRSFPGWYANDTIRFFHPFYTAKQNAEFAKAQGYGDMFKETAGTPTELVASPPKKPEKPLYLDQYSDITVVLEGHTGKNFINSAFYCKKNLPVVVKDVLESTKTLPENCSTNIQTYLDQHKADLKKYLDDLMRYMVKRESISMTNSTFQIDVVRDFAIPVVTRYVATFLGFGQKISEVAGDAKGTFSENEIYQHITNCHSFLTYNPDETKWMQRRKDFIKSMNTLIELTQNGTIWEAGSWGISQTLFGTKEKSNPMHDLGVFVAKEVLKYEKDQEKAAAILLLVCLDFAYNAVVALTGTLDGYMDELYRAANPEARWKNDTGKAVSPPQWPAIQALALDSSPAAFAKLETLVKSMVQKKVRIPLIRRALKEGDYKFSFDTEDVHIDEGQPVVLDLTAAEEHASNEEAKKFLRMAFQFRIADKFNAFLPQGLASLSLTAMIKFIAQMQNPRRGHASQGKLKRVRLDSTPEGYANYMAPMRVAWISKQVKTLKKKDQNKTYNEDMLRPEVHTYLTPTWDQFVAFPMTWKIRFDGFGPSDYATYDKDTKKMLEPYGVVKYAAPLPDYLPPWYQPVGPSSVGGSFATVACTCAAGPGAGHGEKGGAKSHVTPVTNGCGMSH
ncbi:putative prostaglandin G/H synthase 2/cyclooxygenase 2, pgh2/cox2 [Microdochium bolleyi]|uniref:Putative prostaglandin G/H synthase 2/cyclooxygenase 2, pgh2/cox2 n=1 Tax=Microdochium bolleyi TaxID=196109 RepID=A0A136IY81_9PEZI|nr:putative prostaglandin G/H synthase 2/cyclooxygenase 2, pgh2/cox2 [Microdochium bolleyi]